jgi:glutamate formiminotransferase
VLECIVNVSEGRDAEVLAALGAAAGEDLLDLHVDPHHHRAVLTTVGEDAARRIAEVAVDRIDLRDHDGVHPRLGAIDVVPFVALRGATDEDAAQARDDFAAWVGDELGLPAFAYGGDAPTLPEVRQRAFAGLAPVAGPSRPHPTAGAVAVGWRGPLVAYNVWLAEPDLAVARRVANEVRGEGIRALGLAVGDRVQVSMNLVEPDRIGPAVAFDRVADRVEVAGAELVGLVPQAVLEEVPPGRRAALDLAADRTVEARLAARP